MIAAKNTAATGGRHRSCRATSFRTWFRRVTGRAFVAPVEATRILPAVGDLIDHPDVRAMQLRALGDVEVRHDPEFVPRECGWCPESRRITTVRVHGAPDPLDPHEPLQVAEVCHVCAMRPYGPVRQALVERVDLTRPIRLEVCP
ncbi:hypothetical protein SAMN04489729_4839 [Amycolatopsis lurida]|uniref:Uncharacterized protein n=1 Tax=Amycolatopsis lurida NRRL 2430 TaxID=1460371 RepID=A0A2P2FW89_AMYLU|nr:hypothetical protein [Amycolatopsis lurida]KFU80989.1 hypothetical protein BB31_11440 [Amycolatopsis lurida NRRL 2430]SED61659.1 hypothetical protein SAMN04489729_4839 [Amycolatopsis lurida]